jgi:hypothetical protein
MNPYRYSNEEIVAVGCATQNMWLLGPAAAA